MEEQAGATCPGRLIATLTRPRHREERGIPSGLAAGSRIRPLMQPANLPGPHRRARCSRCAPRIWTHHTSAHVMAFRCDPASMRAKACTTTSRMELSTGFHDAFIRPTQRAPHDPSKQKRPPSRVARAINQWAIQDSNLGSLLIRGAWAMMVSGDVRTCGQFARFMRVCRLILWLRRSAASRRRLAAAWQSVAVASVTVHHADRTGWRLLYRTIRPTQPLPLTEPKERK